MNQPMPKAKTFKGIAWGSVLGFFIVVSVFGLIIYKRLFSPNLLVGKKSELYLYIPTGSRFDDVVAILNKGKLLKDEESFRWTACEMKYDKNVKPGRYLLKEHMNNKDLIALLRSGNQTPLDVVFNNIRTKEQLAEKVGSQLEATPSSILNLLNDPDYTKELGFTPESILSMFIPNTYEMYWNTSADKFIRKMKKEYDKFWTADRINRARKRELTPLQISIIASIVQLETNKPDEKSIVAGVYVNRFKKDWKLEADPTLVYALGDLSVSRVLNVYKEIDSPYNTYMYKGLPPGPICLPTIESLDAVLNYMEHDFMYFCAKDDFSGYHAFASTYSKHIENAHRFQRALDKRGIKS